ncbi:STAS/SEC14 domain-containing protein [Methylobacterium sp. E-046]|uniref:STAS/SEC14 domain-containing protein n=1 Tax=Methylobacterium sp. E-046 TaxID=2836576 RepID=UPI001FBB2609|nr:STAS/SEC14 domain-containing protein [Methylobacterium sp. E-046]MCJ2099477.1 STAS/SEC14 domain-containing protein [Methylobacterium sp. E-046]
MLDSRTLGVCGSKPTTARFSTTAKTTAPENLMNAAPDGSVIQRDAPRADLIAFEIKDKITKPDIEWMSAITDEAMKAHGKIDMLLIMSNYEGSALDAKFDGYANEVKVRSVAHIRKYVVVGAPMFARAMIKLSGTVIPVETKTFDLAEEAAAWAYLSEAGPAAT